jgi:tetratricopeptide (TPR) repeat protein
MTMPLECRSCGRALASAGLAVCPHCGQSLTAPPPSGGAGDPLWMELDASPAPTSAARPRPSPPIPNVPNIPMPPSAPAEVPRMRPVEVPVPIDDFEEKLARIDRRRRVSERSREGARDGSRDGSRERSGNRRRPVQPKGTNWPIIAGIIGIVAVLGSSVVAVMVSLEQQQQIRPIFRAGPRPCEAKIDFAELGDPGDMPVVPADFGDIDQIAAEIKLKFGAVDPRVQAELRQTLDELGNQIRLRDEAAVARKISGTRFLEEILACARLERADILNFVQTARGAETAMAQTFVRNVNDWRWTDFEVKRVTPIDAQTMKVLTRYKTARGTKIVTWWLSKRRDGWRVYDYEHYWSVRGVIRHAGILDSLNLAIGPAPEEFETMRALREANEILNADLTGEGAAKADRVLGRLRADQVPKLLVPGYRGMRTQIFWRRQQYGQAVAENNTCRQAERDRASLDLWDGMLRYDLKQYPDALERLERFHRSVGATSESMRELGTVLVALNRRPEARDAFRKSLDDQPDDPNVYFWFLTMIEPNRKEDDVGRRFMALSRPSKEYERFAADCKNAGDFESLRQLATAMCGIDGRSPLPREHLALVEARLDPPEQALATFRKAMELETITHHRATAATEFLREMANADHAIEAYTELSEAPVDVIEPEVLFLSLAENVRYRPALLRRLVRLHAREHGNDPHLRMFRAEMLAADGKDAEADADFTAAVAQLREGRDRPFVDSFRQAWVGVRFRLGKAVESLDDFEARGQAFMDLVSLCTQTKKFDLLEKIVDRCLKDDPQDVMALRQRMLDRIRRGKTEEGIALYRKLTANKDREATRLVDTAFLMAMADKNLAHRAYREANDPKEAFRFLADSLQSAARQADIDKLNEAYAADHPGDPMLPLLRARQLVRRKEYAAAIEQFDLAAKGKFDANPNRYADPRRESIYARYKAGKAVAACLDVEPRAQTFTQLVNYAIRDRDWPLVEKLIAAHRERLPGDPGLDEATARLLVQRRKPAEAAALFGKIVAARKLDVNRDNLIVGYDPWQTFFADMSATDQALEAYERAPDRRIAFENLANLLGIAKKTELLAQLLDRHRKEPDPSPRLVHHRGVLHLLKGEYAAAEKDFRMALGKAKPYERVPTRNLLFQAGIEQGRAVALLREFAPAHPETFRDLASQCMQRKRGDQLRELLAVQRKDPDREPLELDSLEIEMLWLVGDHEGLLRKLETHADAFRQAGMNWHQTYAVRSLVKLGRYGEALAAAESLPGEDVGLPLHKMLVFAAQGKVDRVLELARTYIRDDYDVEACYRHEDLGPILRGDGFARFRERFPDKPPAALPGDGDDD